MLALWVAFAGNQSQAFAIHSGRSMPSPNAYDCKVTLRVAELVGMVFEDNLTGA